jgi:RNA polymerase primary sigma factor
MTPANEIRTRPTKKMRKSDDRDRAEERKLFHRVAAGDQEAEQELARRHLPLVKTVARKYRTPGADFEDLVQEGWLGLIKAIRRFDPERGFRFSTYAHWWIRQALSRFVKGPTRLIRLPEYVHDEISQVHRTREQVLAETGHSPTEKELEADLHFDEGRVRWLDQLSSDASSLDARVRDGSGIEVGNGLASEARDPEDVAADRVTWEKVRGEMRHLPNRQARILNYRFGMEDGHPRSLSWVGKKIGLSPERVRQLERRALESLRLRAA